MNQNLIYKLLVLSLVTLLPSCYIDLGDDGIGCESGRGDRLTEQRSLPQFNRITNAIGADIVLRQGQGREFQVTAPQNLLNNVTTQVVNGELIIDFRGCYKNADIDIFIATPQIEGVHNIGSGDIFGDNAWNTETLDLRITGSGRIDAEFETQSLFAEITGSGVMELYGATGEGDIKISGSGDIYAFNLESNEQYINISGSGGCEVFVHDLLDVRISGSGDVYYKGHPQVYTSISGSGGVFNAN